MKNLILSALITLFCISCSVQDEYYTENPNAVEEVASHLLLPGIQAQSFKNLGAQPMRVAGIIMNQFEGADVCLPMNFFVIGRDVMDEFWISGAYAGTLTNAKALETYATERNQFTYRGIARIFLANEFGVMTTCFGDVPFSEALRGNEFLRPKYDKQQDVYEGIQTLLDNAIEDLQTGIDGNEEILSDIVFNGDANKWIAAAYALKARFYVHTSKQFPNHWNLAKDAAQTALNQNFEDVSLTFETNAISNWTLNKFATERSGLLGFHNSFYEMLENDPRRSSYAKPGWAFDYDIHEIDNVELKWTQSDATIPLISACELHFILAEAAARNGDNTLAIEHTKNAMKENFKMLDLTQSNDFIENKNFETITVEQIMEEAYKAYYGYNFLQTWTNYRRTGFPQINIDLDDTTNSLNPSGVIPTRYMYVESEFNNNRDNLLEAETRQGGGFLDNPMWAFK